MRRRRFHGLSMRIAGATILIGCVISAGLVFAQGGVIAYSITPPNNNNEIYIINEDGTGRVRLTNRPGRDAGPAWSPDGERIAFYAHTPDETSWFLYMMDADGSNIRQLTHTVGLFDGSPEWSPDGMRLTFGRTYPEQNYRSEVWIINADGTDAHRVGNEDGDQPDWSPDGGRLVFAKDVDGNYEIHTMNVDGSDLQRLTQNDDQDFWPSWSPDGSRIAFQGDRDGNYEIYTMAADGSDVVRLTHHTAGDWEPKWSPDGDRIVFNSQRDGHYEVYVMNSDGTDQRRVTTSSVHAIQPHWKPDASSVGDESADERQPSPVSFHMHDNFPNPFNSGTRISYELMEKADVELVVLNRKGEAVRVLASGSKPDGRHSVDWDGLDGAGRPMPSGIYFCRMKVGKSTTTMKLTLVR